MKRFIIHIVLFGLLILSSILTVFCLADGTTDASYLKLTTPKQSALVLGTSRAAQGIQPRYLNSELKRDDVYNYAFQLPTSPYGEAYLESIKKKIDLKTSNGLFILDVNPWTLARQIDTMTNEEILRDRNKFVDKTSCVNLSPNIEYLVESYGSSYIQLIMDKYRKGDVQTVFVNEDGWLEVTIESNKINNMQGIGVKIDRYRKKLDVHDGWSEYRLNYLHQTISFLKEFGKVYMVRIPVIDDMHTIENQLLEGFDDRMESISEMHQIPYINLMPQNRHYSYTDGNHLDSASGRQFTIELARQIKQLESQ